MRLYAAGRGLEHGQCAFERLPSPDRLDRCAHPGDQARPRHARAVRAARSSGEREMDSRTWQTQAGNRSVLNAPRVRAAAAAALLLAAPAFGAAPGDADAPAANTPILHLATESPAPAAGVSEGVPQETPAPTRVSAGQDGFAIESGNGDFRLQIGLLLHADGRFAIDDDDDGVTDTLALNRVRPYLAGRRSRRVEFFLTPGFAGGTLVVQDAYVDTVFTKAFRIRAGKAKTPFGLERLQSASGMLFFNRAFPP